MGEKIKMLRLEMGMSQRELSEISFVSLRTIQKVESNLYLRPNYETIRRLAIALKVSPAYLIGGNDV